MSNIDLNRISQKKIRKFIISQKDQNITNFSGILSSCNKEKDLSGFFKREFAFIIKEDPDKVWNRYNTISPTESWNGRIISFGLLFSKSTGFIMYNDDDNFSGLDTGQVLYLNLKFLWGIYNLAVGLVIISIDNENKSITFSYLDEGKTEGLQTIHIATTKKGYSKIIYSAFYKSNSAFRDKFLYPYFHHKAIKEFHRNMKSIILLKDIKKDELILYGYYC
ncbi:hypothetical protein ACFLTE_05650 [Bacteroidota bacterium]